jgi:hypothetical protein
MVLAFGLRLLAEVAQAALLLRLALQAAAVEAQAVVELIVYLSPKLVLVAHIQ